MEGNKHVFTWNIKKNALMKSFKELSEVPVNLFGGIYLIYVNYVNQWPYLYFCGTYIYGQFQRHWRYIINFSFFIWVRPKHIFTLRQKPLVVPPSHKRREHRETNFFIVNMPMTK